MAIEDPKSYVCMSAKEIGKLAAQIDAQDATDQRIEKALLELKNEYQQYRDKSLEGFITISNDIAKLSTVMADATARQHDMLELQRQTNIELTELKAVTTALKSDYTQHKVSSDQQLQANHADIVSVDKRVTFLENQSYFWYKLFAIAASVIAFISGLVHIVGMIQQ